MLAAAVSLLTSLLLRLAVTAVAFVITAWVLSGMELSGGVFGALWVSILFGLVNTIVGTVVRIFTLPLILLTLGLFAIVVNALMLELTDAITSHLTIDEFFWTAIWAAIILGLVTVVLEFVVGRLVVRPDARSAVKRVGRFARTDRLMQGLVDVGGRRLWTSLAGTGAPTVVFEAGGGNDSSVWAAVEPEVRRRNGVRTLVYDRAGLGKSDPPPAGEYRIGDEADALVRALDVLRLLDPIVLVAHSYGGFVAHLVAGDPRVAGVVLVDANLPAYFDEAVVERLLADHKPHFAELEQQAPELARVMVPLMRAYPETARAVRAVDYPSMLPTIDIVAERSWGRTHEENDALRRVHEEFVAAAPAVREGVLAAGSGHDVMRDRPDVVSDAVARLVERVRVT